MRKLVTPLLLLAVALVAGSPAVAQEMRRVTEPTPLDANDPLAVRSATLVKHLLAAEKDAAVAFIKKEGDDAFVNSGKMEGAVDAQIKRLSSGKYKITEYETGFGSDVIVFLTNDRKEDANIVIRYNGDKKITGFAEAKINR